MMRRSPSSISLADPDIHPRRTIGWYLQVEVGFLGGEERCERFWLLRRTAHALVLRHAFSAADFGALVYAWQVATLDPGTGRHQPTTADATVRRG